MSVEPHGRHKNQVWDVDEAEQNHRLPSRELGPHTLSEV